MNQLDKPNSDVEALERLASFLGTLFVKNEITATDEEVLAAVAKRRPNLKGGSELTSLNYSSQSIQCCVGRCRCITYGIQCQVDPAVVNFSRPWLVNRVTENSTLRGGQRVHVHSPPTKFLFCSRAVLFTTASLVLLSLISLQI